jgi:hypothetical protein
MRAATLILEPHKPLGGFLGMNGPMPRPLRRHLKRAGLGDSTSSGSIGDAIWAGIFPPASLAIDASNYVIPGSTPSDILYNATTGDLSTAQSNNQVTSETATLVQGGMDPADAAAQAASDNNLALTTYSGPGAFGVITTGAAPGQGITASLGSGLSSLFGGMPIWAILGLGGVGLLLIAKGLSK